MYVEHTMYIIVAVIIGLLWIIACAFLVLMFAGAGNFGLIGFLIAVIVLLCIGLALLLGCVFLMDFAQDYFELLLTEQSFVRRSHASLNDPMFVRDRLSKLRDFVSGLLLAFGAAGGILVLGLTAGALGAPVSLLMTVGLLLRKASCIALVTNLAQRSARIGAFGGVMLIVVSVAALVGDWFSVLIGNGN